MKGRPLIQVLLIAAFAYMSHLMLAEKVGSGSIMPAEKGTYFQLPKTRTAGKVACYLTQRVNPKAQDNLWADAHTDTSSAREFDKTLALIIVRTEVR